MEVSYSGLNWCSHLSFLGLVFFFIDLKLFGDGAWT